MTWPSTVTSLSLGRVIATVQEGMHTKTMLLLMFFSEKKAHGA
jgi:hypothetical protein